jgi:hypothetical protein
VLLQNQRLSAQYPVRLRGGPIGQERSLWGRADRLNFAAGEAIPQSAGVPSGYLAPASWVLPKKTGFGSASGFSGSSGVATGAAGRNGIADAVSTSTGVATGTAVSQGAATGASISAGTAEGVAIVSGSASGLATSSGTALSSSTASGTAQGFATSAGTVVPYAIAWGSASNLSAGLTADGIATSVWAALAASNDVSGSMGELLNQVGAGGLSPTQQALLEEIHRRLGLDALAPLTTTPTSISAGNIDMTITGDGETTSTVTRQ